MKNKGDCIMNNENFKELERILNSKWRFFGTENNEEVAEAAVDNEFICDLDNNFINILSDFYSVESINLLNKESESFFKDEISLKKIANQHSKLLRLKLFFRIELNKCLNTIKNNELDFENYYLDIPLFEDITSIWKFIISKLDDADYSIEKLFAFSLISKYLENLFYYRKYYWRSYENVIPYYLENDFRDIVGCIIKVLEDIDKYIEKCEKVMLSGSNFSRNVLSLVNIEDFRIFDNFFNINKFTSDFYEAVKNANELEKKVNLEKYAFEELICYASMKIGSDNYMTFNGIENPSLQCDPKRNKIINILKKLVGNLHYVEISDETRYYTSNNKYITFEQYKSANPKASMNRMFTCCERKLLAKFIELEKDMVELAVTIPPCIFCERAINLLNHCSEEDRIKIKTTKSNTVEGGMNPLKVIEYDNFAKEILEKIEKKINKKS